MPDITATGLATRVIPCLDVTDGRVVKGVQFVDLRQNRLLFGDVLPGFEREFHDASAHLGGDGDFAELDQAPKEDAAGGNRLPLEFGYPDQIGGLGARTLRPLILRQRLQSSGNRLRVIETLPPPLVGEIPGRCAAEEDRRQSGRKKKQDSLLRGRLHTAGRFWWRGISDGSAIPWPASVESVYYP